MSRTESSRVARASGLHTCGEYDRDWLRGLLSDLADDGLVEHSGFGDGTVARLRR